MRAGLPSLRRELARRTLEHAFARGCDRSGFRLIHYSIQSNHMHLIVEASDRRAPSRGMQGLSIRVARALNRLWRRTGSVFADRYHERILRSQREVRYALAYVLLNACKHGIDVRGIDPFTSGESFDGWRDGGRASIAQHVSAPRTWLLCVGADTA
jgi:REP element-mobilizing transposase RayT